MNNRTAALELLHARRVRDTIFGADRDGFGEPGWDVLLMLVAQDGTSVTQQALSATIGAPATIVSLYVQWAASRGLVELEDDMVRLSDRGRRLMCAYLDENRRQ